MLIKSRLRSIYIVKENNKKWTQQEIPKSNRVKTTTNKPTEKALLRRNYNSKKTRKKNKNK